MTHEPPLIFHIMTHNLQFRQALGKIPALNCVPTAIKRPVNTPARVLVKILPEIHE